MDFASKLASVAAAARAARPHLLMVLALTLTLVLVLTLALAPSGMIRKKAVPYFCPSTVLLSRWQ